MEFFRKYQRLILYSAGIFALVTFSATTSIYGFFDSVFQTRAPMPVMQIGGREVEVKPIDNDFAGRIVRWESSAQDPTLVMPYVVSASSDDSRVEIYAALRRIAIEFGIEVSDDEVNRAIEQGVALRSQADPQVTDATMLALRLGFASLPAYREVIREAMRIATLVRLESLAVDTSDAALLAELVEGLERISLQAAVVDAEVLQEGMENGSEGLTDEELVAWLEGLETFEKSSFVDPDRYRIEAAYLQVGEDFDPADFAAELEDPEFSDDEVEQFYNRQRFRLYQKPKTDDGSGGDGNGDEGGGEDGESAGETSGDTQDETDIPEYLELDDALKARIRRRLQAERVVDKLWGQVGERLETYLEAERAAVSAAEGPVAEAAIGLDEARLAADAEGAGAAAEAVVTAAEAALEVAEAALEAAKDQLVAKREQFPLAEAWTELAAGRAGFGVVSSGEESQISEDLKDLEVVGPWEGYGAVVALNADRPLSTAVQHTVPAVFHVRLVERESSPLKPLEDIREDARSRYFSERADERAEELAESFKEQLEELAKARIQEQIGELVAERDAKLAERLGEWRTALSERLEADRERLTRLEAERGASARVTVAFRERVAGLESELADEDSRREEILAELQAEVDEDIEELTREQYPEVFEAAVAATDGVVLEQVGPLPRNLSDPATGAHRESYPKAVRLLFFGNRVSDLEEGDAVEMVQDFTERAWVAAIVTGVESGTLEDITRRQLLQARQSAAASRRQSGVMQSYSLEALEKRFGWRRPTEVASPVEGEQ